MGRACGSRTAILAEDVRTLQITGVPPKWSVGEVSPRAGSTSPIRRGAAQRDVGAGHQVVTGPKAVWDGCPALASYRADRARARPTATATEKTATANRAQMPQFPSSGPMTSADMEVASYAPEMAWSAQ